MGDTSEERTSTGGGGGGRGGSVEESKNPDAADDEENNWKVEFVAIFSWGLPAFWALPHLWLQRQGKCKCWGLWFWTCRLLLLAKLV